MKVVEAALLLVQVDGVGDDVRVIVFDSTFETWALWILIVGNIGRRIRWNAWFCGLVSCET
jgi:hypothetical protein